MSLVVVLTGAALLACGGTKTASRAPAKAAASPAPAPAQQAPRAREPDRGPAGPAAEGSAGGDDKDAELVVSREVVGRCPTLRLVKAHVAELDPDMVWLAVLESIAECMSEGGPMASQMLGVSGDEEHRHVVREVLGTRGVAPTRVVAQPQSAAGVAECQAGTDCHPRIEITIVAP